MATTENRRARLEGCACAAYVNAPNGRGDCRRTGRFRAPVLMRSTRLIGEAFGRHEGSQDSAEVSNGDSNLN